MLERGMVSTILRNQVDKLVLRVPHHYHFFLSLLNPIKIRFSFRTFVLVTHHLMFLKLCFHFGSKDWILKI